jgi:hypothetical protein
MVWIRGGAEKKANGTFWIGFDQVWTRGGDALTSRLCGGYSSRVVRNPGEEVGCDFELCPAVLYSGGSIYCDVRRHLVTLGVLLECIVVL